MTPSCRARRRAMLPSAAGACSPCWSGCSTFRAPPTAASRTPRSRPARWSASPSKATLGPVPAGTLGSALPTCQRRGDAAGCACWDCVRSGHLMLWLGAGWTRGQQRCYPDADAPTGVGGVACRRHSCCWSQMRSPGATAAADDRSSCRIPTLQPDGAATLCCTASAPRDNMISSSLPLHPLA